MSSNFNQRLSALNAFCRHKMEDATQGQQRVEAKNSKMVQKWQKNPLSYPLNHILCGFKASVYSFYLKRFSQRGESTLGLYDGPSQINYIPELLFMTLQKKSNFGRRRICRLG